MSLHYSHKPMCISLTSDTLTQVLRETMESLIRWGSKNTGYQRA